MAQKKHKQKKSKLKIFLIALCIILLGVSFFAGGVFLKETVFASGEFYRTTKINGTKVGGLNKSQASNILQTDFLAKRDKIEIYLSHNNDVYILKGSDFEVTDSIPALVDIAYENTSSGNFFEKRLKVKKLKQQDSNVTISYRQFLAGFDDKVQAIIDQVSIPKTEPYAEFTPDEESPFVYHNGTDGIVVDKEELYQKIDEEFANSLKIYVTIPTYQEKQTKTLQQVKDETALRGSFSTSYKTSSADRKYNVKKALSSFNGMIVAPEQEVSFNSTTGARTAENGYKKANIILGGVYVEGTGGGVCQASTTLYNALLYSDLEILEVNRHSLPASYVPLGFDAMVSEGLSDLRFKNTTSNNIYIKTYYDAENVYVQIFGEKFPDGFKIERKAEFVKTIPHNGDRIVVDQKGEYSDKVTFKGEYLRLKYPREGYESNAYILKFQDGELIDQKLIRHEIYAPQDGIIIEGAEEPYAGITIPENKVKFIPPQSETTSNENTVKDKIASTNPAKYNP